MPQSATPCRPTRERRRYHGPGRAGSRRVLARLLIALPIVLSAAVAHAQLRFGSPASYAAGPGARAVALGDLNHDGRPDLVVVNNGANTITVRLNQGNGSFGPATSFATGLNPVHVALADLDGDGNLDAVVANQGQGDNTVSLFFGNGTGSFAPRVDRQAGTLPTFVAIGDLNRNGLPDIVVADNGAGQVTVLVNLGHRNFAAGVGYPVAPSPVNVAIGQLNADGNLDVAEGGGSPAVDLLFGAGNGALNGGASLQFVANPSAIGIADVNRDGAQDLLVTLYSMNQVAVVPGNGDGTFKAPAFYSTGNAPVAIAAGDLNGDGWPDALVANINSSSVSVLLGDGTGGLTALTPVSTQSPISLATADVNGDGLPDFAVTNNGNFVSVFPQTPSPPLIRAVPASLAFGASYVGFQAVQTLRIQNIGSLPLTITQATVSSPAYSLLDPLTVTLARGEFRDVRVQFAPATPGDYPATLTLVSNDGAHPSFTVPLSGSAAYPPATQVSPASLTLTAIVGASDSQILAIGNAGLGPMTYSLATVGATPTWLTFGPPSGSLAPGGSAQVTVGASAFGLFGGVYTAVLRVSSNDPFHPQIDVPITFTVIGKPRIGVSPNILDFGLGYLGSAQSLTLNVSNPGTQTLSVSSMTSDSPEFIVSGPTSFQVAPGDLLPVSITYRRQIEGHVSGTLLIACNDPITPTVGVPLAGSAVDPPRITVSPQALPRVIVAVGDSVLQPLTLSNTSHATALDVQLAISPPPPTLILTPPFAVSEESATIDPGGSLVVQVAFRGVNRPGQDLNSTLTITSNDPANPTIAQALALHVRGVPKLAAAPSPLNFGTGFKGVPDTLLLTVSNTGTDTLLVAGAVPSDPDFSVLEPAFFPLLAGATHPLHVRFGRSANGSASAQLTISSNDPAQPAIVPLIGVVNEPPVVQVAPASIAVAVALGDSALVPLSILNAGLGPLDFSISVRRPPPPAPLQGVSTLATEAVYSTDDPDPARARAAPADPPPAPQRDAGPHTLATTRVLVIGDGGTEGDVAPILTGVGYPVTLVSDDSAWDGTNPSPDGYGTVVLLDGIDFGDNMPAAGQQALLDFVRGGGGVVVTEWISYEVSQGRYAGMTPLVPITRTTGLTGLLDYAVVASHAVTDGVSPAFQVAAAVTKGTLNSGTAVVKLASGEPAVVVKEEGLGRVVDFAVAGNYNGRRPFLATDMRRLLLNAVSWTTGFRWLSYLPSTGTIAGGAKGVVNVKMVTTGLVPGIENVELLLDSNDPTTPRIVIPLQLTIVTGPTPVLASLVSAEAEADRVRIRWYVAGADAPAATIYRERAHQGWSVLRTASADGSGFIVCEDRDVAPGESYGYRLGVREAGSERMVGETWVQTPAAVLALHGVWPTPSDRDLVVSFSLPDRRGGRIELFDVHGRRWMALALDSFGAGRHEARLDPRGVAPPGIYWVRLTSGTHSLTTRAVLLR